MRSFISATDISKRLCETRDAQELLPQLIDKLITASIPMENIKALRVPVGDQIHLHGVDSTLAIDDEIKHQYIPSGFSIWEAGTDKDPKSKADKAFAAAATKLSKAFPDIKPSLTPDKATFVFVTSKPWEYGEWIKENLTKSTWKSIKVLDAVDLAKWLEQCPTVMLWLAKVCGLPAEGLYDAEQYLHKIGVGFRLPNLSPELVIAGREDARNFLRNLILKSNNETNIYGESIEEAAMFLAAASIIEKKEYAKTKPLVFADAKANLNLLATHNASLMLLPLDSEALVHAKELNESKWRMIIPQVKSKTKPVNNGKDLELEQCKRTSVESLLVKKMKFDENKARQITRDSKGSLIALLWLIGAGPIGSPRWASRKDATTHASLLLAGGWVGSNENDTKIVEQLSRKDYRDIETLLQSAEVPEGPWVHRGEEWICASKDFVWGQLADKITETMLKDFHRIVNEVLGEKDPTLELPIETRYMANILGKTRKYSKSLRQGLVDSIARLAIFKQGGQANADRIVFNLLDPNSPDALVHWISLQDILSEIAEASPNQFLDCLDKILKQKDANQFFQDPAGNGSLFTPTSTHVYLLWALERLVWQKEYFTRILVILARLAKIDPGVKIANTPKNSLIKILLPWRPQHTESNENVLKTLETLYANSPAITWDVVNSLLPDSHSITSPTPKPVYRMCPDEPTISNKDYWEFIYSLLLLMTKWANTNIVQWVSLIKAYPEIYRKYKEAAKLITDALLQIAPTNLTENDKAEIYTILRELIAKHKRFSETYWALDNSGVKILEDIHIRFIPKDLVLLHAHLFSWHPNVVDAPKPQYGPDWESCISEKRASAVKSIYEQAGFDGILRLIEIVKLPDSVGFGIAQLNLSQSELIKFFQKSLPINPSTYSQNHLLKTARTYIWCMYRDRGEAWLNNLLTKSDITWTTEMYSNLALGLPPSPNIWELLRGWGEEAENLYWRNVDIRGDYRKYWPQIIDKWKKVKRPWSSLELIATLVQEDKSDTDLTGPSLDQVVEILEMGLQPDNDIEKFNLFDNTMISYYAEHAFSFLDAQNIDKNRLANLEWGWFNILEDTGRGVKVLHHQITSSPELFVQLLINAFIEEGGKKGDNIPENKIHLAQQAINLLGDIRTVPGYKSDKSGGSVDYLKLEEWISKARKLSEEVKRLEVCDIKIGKILSYSPCSPDGSWPCVEVRNIIEKLQSLELESGFKTGKYNQRGVISRDKGGNQEHSLAEKYRKLANKIRSRWPRTTNILDKLTRDYEEEARYWDEEEKKREYE